MLEDTRMAGFLILQIWNHGSQRHAAEAENCCNEEGVTREKIWAVAVCKKYIFFDCTEVCGCVWYECSDVL